jgi:phage-related holin
MFGHVTGEIKAISNTILELNLKQPLLFWIGTFSIGAITGFIKDWIIDPPEVYIAIVVLVVCDWVSGVVIAVDKGDFRTDRALTILWRLFAHIALFYFATVFSKNVNVLFWMNEAMVAPIVIANLLSLMKNLTLLGVIKGDVILAFYKNIDKYKEQIDEK